MMKKLLILLPLLLIQLLVMAQPDKNVQMADEMRANGKIYVVVAVILTIFAGIIIYLVRLDRKMSRIEKNVNS